jgi:DNA-binding NtrC family response regulator
MSQRTAVAIIDDEESVRKSLVRMLEAKGLEALAFASAKEFLNSPQSEIVSCVVSDLRMPGLDGLDLHVVDKMAAQSLADLVLMAERLGIKPHRHHFTKARGRLTS